VTDDARTATPITAEGAQHPGPLPRGLRCVPRGVDELATEHLVLNMGPQHPSTHGVLHVLVELDGEEVIAAEASLGYLHRGIGEMRQCLRLIRQLLDGMPEGEHSAKRSRVLKVPAGESYAAVESPRGELGIHLVSDGGLTPYRMRLRSPAYFNLAVVDEALAGGLIADAIVTLGSLDIVLGEIDR
jgi:NADH:ubiquinone oxidoreductase subunit D